jgi:hypothetical protein
MRLARFCLTAPSIGFRDSAAADLLRLSSHDFRCRSDAQLMANEISANEITMVDHPDAVIKSFNSGSDGSYRI